MSATESLRELIDRMKVEQAEKAQIEALEHIDDETTEVEGFIEAPDARGVREVAKQLALVRIQKSAVEKVEQQLAGALKVLIGQNKGIMAGGEKLAKKAMSHVVRVNTEVVRSMFPPDQFPQLYDESDQERLLIDPEFKRHVLEEQAREIEA